MTRLAIAAAIAMSACGGPPAGSPDAPSDTSAADAAPDAPATAKIAHVVIIVQENHTFDAYFGHWCTGPAGAGVPPCTQGASCCEAAPATDASGHAPIALDDAANGAHAPDHTHDCEASEMNGGAIDKYAAGASCSDSRNVALADPATTVATYAELAKNGALADRYFQPEIGSSSANDMYFAVAQHVFDDNAWKPDTNGAGCTLPATRTKLTGVTTLADLLIAHGNTFAFYAQGYAAMKAATLCPAAPSDCPLHLPTTPCDYDPSDVPFEYYAQFADNATYMKDYDDLASDVAAGALPDVAFVKGVGYRNEHPGYGTVISVGEAQVKSVVDLIEGSPYAPDTLVLITWDEGGGLWDHVAPPAAIDAHPYGTRVPLIAVGPLARHGAISHTVMEHSSVVKLIEWNFLGATGQLGARDAQVANLGSLLDPATGVPAL